MTRRTTDTYTEVLDGADLKKAWKDTPKSLAEQDQVWDRPTTSSNNAKPADSVARTGHDAAVLLRLHTRFDTWLRERSYISHSTVTAVFIAGIFVAAIVVIKGSETLSRWDLSQPQATLIAGLIGGPFLIVAAVIAFRGQAQTRKDEREKFDLQLAEQRRQMVKQLDMQAEVASKQNLTVLLAEEQKHRREVTFESLRDAMTAVLALRRLWNSLDEACRADDEHMVLSGEQNLEDPATPNTDLVREDVDKAKEAASAVAEMLSLLGHEDAYNGILRARHLLSIRAEGPPRLASEGERDAFQLAHADAVDTLRHIYKSA